MRVPALCSLLIACVMATTAGAEATRTGSAGQVRVLDKITGRVGDLSMSAGQETTFGYLTVSLGECRYPAENPEGDAFIQVVIRDAREPEPVFSGWMIASSPALNPFDHPRYDVWALSCSI